MDSVEKNYRDTESSAELAFNRIESNILYKIREKTDPELNKILYIRGILRNRFQNELHPGELRYIVQTMRHVVDEGIMTVDKLKAEALTAENLAEWYTTIDYCIAMHKKEMDEQNESQTDS